MNCRAVELSPGYYGYGIYDAHYSVTVMRSRQILSQRHVEIERAMSEGIVEPRLRHFGDSNECDLLRLLNYPVVSRPSRKQSSSQSSGEHSPSR
jgi:hypothetical protein